MNILWINGAFRVFIDRFTQMVLESVTLDILNDLQWGLMVSKDDKNPSCLHTVNQIIDSLKAYFTQKCKFCH